MDTPNPFWSRSRWAGSIQDIISGVVIVAAIVVAAAWMPELVR